MSPPPSGTPVSTTEPIVPSRSFALLSTITVAPAGSFISQRAIVVHAAVAGVTPAKPLAARTPTTTTAHRREPLKDGRKKLTLPFSQYVPGLGNITTLSLLGSTSNGGLRTGQKAYLPPG